MVFADGDSLFAGAEKSAVVIGSSSRNDEILLRSRLYTFLPIRVKTKNSTNFHYSTYFDSFCNHLEGFWLKAVDFSQDIEND